MSPRPPVRVRDVRWGDFDDLIRGYWHLYDERKAGQPHGIHLFGRKPTRAEEVDWFGNHYRRFLRGDTVSVVAEVGGKVVGHCSVIRIAPDAEAENGHNGLLGILVEHGYRGRGVGTALLRAALAQCRSKFRIVRLSVNADNPGARRLYERFGFRWVGRWPEGVRKDGVYVDEDLMVLRFDRPARRAARRAPRPRRRTA